MECRGRSSRFSEQLFATIDAFRGRADQFGRAFLDLPTRFGSQCLAFFEQRFEGLGTGLGGQGIGAKAKKPELAYRFLGAANPLRVATLINQVRLCLAHFVSPLSNWN
ncbi:MAG: hypothetical protein V5B30_20330 [Candidatus Accumulibacter delftensis]|jgi:hypothetical protein